MGVSNVNNTNNVQLVKLALQKKSAKSPQVIKPLYLTDKGSIFDADPTKGTNPSRNTITELNVKNSLKTMPAPSNKSGGKNKLNPDNFEGIDSVSGGKAAISTGRAATKDVQAYTVQAEKGAASAKQIGAKSKSFGEKVAADDKTYAARLKVNQKAFEKDNEKIQKLVKETEETQREVDDAQHELERLSLASNSFRMTGSNGTGSNDNQGRIRELQGLIGSKVGLLQQNGKAIYSLQRSQSRTISRMNRTNRQYVRTQHQNVKNVESQKSENSGIIDTATQIEQYSAYAQAGGQAISLAGEALIALGSATLFGTGGFSSGLVTVGTIMKKVGTVLELVGQYGQTAANLTKTVAYAAEGNLMAAMQSCAAAVQTGAAAAKSTAGLKSTFGTINDQANAAKQNIAAKAGAKEAVNSAVENQALKNAGFDIDKLNTEERKEALKTISKDQMKSAREQALGGMTKRQAKKYVTADLRAQMANNKNISNKFKDLKTYVGFDKEKKLQDGLATSSLTKATEAYQKTQQRFANANNITDFSGLNSDGTTTKYTKTKDGLDNISVKKFNRKVNRDFNKQLSGMRKSLPKTSANMGEMLQKLGGSITNIGMVFMQNKAMEEMTNCKGKTLQPYQMNARTRRIMQRNQMYANRFSYV